MPAKSSHNPEDVFNHSGKIMLASPRMDIIDADVFCRYVSREWWIAYRVLRAAAFLATGRRKPDPLFEIPYQDYSDSLDDIPVEAIDGEGWDPVKLIGERKNTYGCYHGCQDIRTTLEWIIAKPIDARLQVRAKWTYALPCPPNMFPEEYEKKSRRARTTPADIEALQLLKMKRFSALVSDDNTHGDDSEMVRGCRCRPGTPEDYERHELIGVAKKGHRSQKKSIFQKDRGPALPTRKKHNNKAYWTDDPDRTRKRRTTKRSRLEHPDGLSPSPGEDELEEEVEESEEQFPEKRPILCADLHLPDRSDMPYPNLGIPQVGTSRDHEEAMQRQLDHHLVQITISTVAGRQVPTLWYDDLELDAIIPDDISKNWP